MLRECKWSRQSDKAHNNAVTRVRSETVAISSDFFDQSEKSGPQVDKQIENFCFPCNDSKGEREKGRRAEEGQEMEGKTNLEMNSLGGVF